MKPEKIFDMHTHAFPDKIAESAVQSLAQGAHIPYYHDGSFAGLQAYEASGGATAFLLLPIATKPESTDSINRWVAKRTGGGVYAFGTLHPDSVDFREEVAQIVALGLRGVKLHPEYQHFFVDDKRVFPLYEAVIEAGLPICFHAGEDLGFPPPVHGDAERIARVAGRYPEGRFIAAHMGGLNQLEKVRRFLAGRSNVWMDTSFAAERMAPEDIAHLVRSHGADHFFFGTDAPWSDFTAAKNALLLAGLSAQEIRDIFWNNAAAFLGIT